MPDRLTDRPTLGEFLRARREQLAPADVGLPAAGVGRRRTPGLRREEVATLAGVSIDYLVRLEQGRDRHPSAAVLGAIADALRLSGDERAHLGRLAAISATPEMCPVGVVAARQVQPSVRALLDRLDPTPAFVVGGSFDVLAWNPSWERLMAPVGVLDHPEPNLARFMFLDPRARAAYPDWSVTADEQASALRSMWLDHGFERDFAALVAELQEVPAFADRWSSHRVTEKRRGTKRLRHPDVGEVRIAYEVLLLPDEDGQRLITWLPADEASDAALDRAITTTSALRAV